ncbi:MAG: PDZ domain-containing protein [Clostridia bacterium]|nr:PDZ domain-containing protein [Clostridia bacterium]
MKKRTQMILVLLSAAVIAFGALFSGEASGLKDFLYGGSQQTVTITRDEYESLQRFEKLGIIMDYIDTYYYQDPDDDLMIEYAIDGMLAALDDPYTFYYNEEAWSDMWADDEGTYAGIGVQLLGNYESNIVTITQVFRDTPAEKAGVRKGDQLVRVDDIIVDATTMEAAVSHMRGESDSAVEVEVIRKGEHITVTMYRAVIHINRVEYAMMDDNVGYIAFYQFAGESDEEVAAAMEALRAQGAKSIILDLRDNPGGWVAQAVSVADLFLDKELLVYAEYRDGSRDENWTKDGKTDIPLYILINGNSASSSEILAGGLQNLGRATLVGTNSYGKGIIQYVIPVDDTNKDGFQFTVAQYYLNDGTAVHKVGIAPDVEVAMPEELEGTYFDLGDLDDPQLKAAWDLAREAAK